MSTDDPDWASLIARADALAKDLRLAAAAGGYRPETHVGVAPPCIRHADQPAGRCNRCPAEAVPPPRSLRDVITRPETQEAS